MTHDKYGSSDSLIAPARECFAITVSDTDDLQHVPKAIYVGGGGDLTLRAVDSAQSVSFRNVPNGTILSVRAIAVLESGTTASDLVGLL